jgi:hypothetical protein
MRKKLKLSSDGDDSRSKKCNEATVVPVVGSGRVWIVKKLYKCCPFNAIYKDNDAINCITTQDKKGSFP